MAFARCHGCKQLISDNGLMRTLEFRDSVTGEPGVFLFLFCGSRGTAFPIERVPDA